MRQYCSGGSSTWSSIHPLFGVCSSGWLRKKHEPAAGPQHAADLGDGVVDGVDVLEHEAGDHGVERVGPRTAAAPALAARVRRAAGRARPPRRSGPTVGSTPTTSSTPRGRRRAAATWPSPQPTSSTASGAGQVARRRAAGSARAYSGSAPSVNPSCHQRGVRPPRGRSSPSPALGHACGRRCGAWRRRHRPPRRAATTAPASSSSDACFTAVHPAELLDEALLAGRAEAGDVVERRSWSCACRAARGGT